VRYLFFLLLIPLSLFAFSVSQKYPSYSYVFSEFDIDTSYVYDDLFAAYVQKHEKWMRRDFHHMLREEKELISMIRGELLEESISDLFLYLSMVESGLHTQIASPKNAVGLWQFMPQTAKLYDLQVCSSMDERLHPLSATRAAVKHLKKLYRRFGKWYLAILAYNCGEGRLSKAIGRAGTDVLEILLDEQEKYLPRETREYLKKVLLLALIGESEAIRMDFISDKEKPEEGDAAVPEKRNHLSKEYLLSHSVELGETLESIAEKYNSDAEEIRAANGLNDNMLEEGSFLVIPVSQRYFLRFIESRD
jgi:membrane-bound lytic murein transglycosylase D